MKHMVGALALAPSTTGLFMGGAALNGPVYMGLRDISGFIVSAGKNCSGFPDDAKFGD